MALLLIISFPILFWIAYSRLLVHHALKLDAEMPLLVWMTYEDICKCGCPVWLLPAVLPMLVRARRTGWRYGKKAPKELMDRPLEEQEVRAEEVQYYDYRRIVSAPPSPNDFRRTTWLGLGNPEPATT